ncbi:MAG: sulfotransferase family 2 domain-containing protein [Hyphomicrobiales bacterium]
MTFHEKPILKLVRNPYDRAVSSFLSMIIHSRPEQANPWGRKPIAAARQLLGKPSDASPTLSFRDFLRFLAHNGTQSGQINGHIARQHLAGEDGCIDRIVRLERFAGEIRQIESEYRLSQSPLEWIGILRNEGSAERPEGGCSPCVADFEMTPDQLKDGRFPPYAAFYDEETRRFVRECFAADFEAYGYEG